MWGRWLKYIGSYNSTQDRTYNYLSVQYEFPERQIIWKNLEARKQKGLFRIAKISEDYLCLKEENISFDNINII